MVYWLKLRTHNCLVSGNDCGLGGMVLLGWLGQCVGAVGRWVVLLSKFARLMKAADTRVHWGGDWPGFKDRPHFEV